VAKLGAYPPLDGKDFDRKEGADSTKGSTTVIQPRSAAGKLVQKILYTNSLQ